MDQVATCLSDLYTISMRVNCQFEAGSSLKLET